MSNIICFQDGVSVNGVWNYLNVFLQAMFHSNVLVVFVGIYSEDLKINALFLVKITILAKLACNTLNVVGAHLIPNPVPVKGHV